MQNHKTFRLFLQVHNDIFAVVKQHLHEMYLNSDSQLFTKQNSKTKQRQVFLVVSPLQVLFLVCVYTLSTMKKG